MTVIKKMRSSSLLTVLVLSLSACSWLKQPAAPVESTYPDANSPSYPGSSQTGGDYGNVPTYPTNPYPPTTNPGGTGYTPSNAPVDASATYHTVVYGDTVYNISKRYGISQGNLMAWNNMPDPTVKLGTRLRVKDSGGGTVTPPPTNTPSNPTPPTTIGTGGSRTVDGITWVPPTKGSVIAGFAGNKMGIDISGSSGQAVVASAPGKVVYSGDALRTYGNLVIIQHNQVYVTAYAHNKRVLVKEGQNVTRGQKIAEMGNSGTDRVKLHFEVRKHGKPVDPSQYVKM